MPVRQSPEEVALLKPQTLNPKQLLDLGSEPLNPQPELAAHISVRSLPVLEFVHPSTWLYGLNH